MAQQCWNHPPGTPAIASLTVTDNGSGEITTTWPGVSDADGDAIYYAVEARPQGGSEFNKYLAQGNTSLKITGLQRNTTYEVRVSSFDTKDRRFSDIKTIKTLDKPEACVQSNTEKVTLSGIPPTMLRRSIPLYDYRQPQAGTSVYPYENTFCVESDIGKFSFADITGVTDIEQTDWLYVESGGEMVEIGIFYTNVSGGLDAIQVATSVPSNYMPYVGNLVRLADFWGPNAPGNNVPWHQWPDSNRVVKLWVRLKNEPSGKTTHRFGRLLVLKENPFGLNFKGFQVNDQSLTIAPYRYLAYTEEPISLEFLTWTNNASLSGGLKSASTQSGPTYKSRIMAAPAAIGLNTYAFTLTNGALSGPPVTDVQTGTFQLDVYEKPILEALVDDSYRTVKAMQVGKTYALRLTGIQKPPRSLLVKLNGATQNVEYREGLYYFTPASLVGKNEISVVLDGVPLASLRLPRLSPISWLSFLLN